MEDGQAPVSNTQPVSDFQQSIVSLNAENSPDEDGFGDIDSGIDEDVVF